MFKFGNIVFLLCVICVGASARGDAQETTAAKPVAVSILDVGRVSDAGFRTSLEKMWLSYDSRIQLYIINYGSNREIARREKMIIDGFNFHRFDRKRITLVRGGGNSPRTVVWKVPDGADDPEP